MGKRARREHGGRGVLLYFQEHLLTVLVIRKLSDNWEVDDIPVPSVSVGQESVPCPSQLSPRRY